MTQEDTSQKIGTGMWMVAWLLLMGGLFLFFDDLINKKYNPNQNLVSQGNEVVLKRNRHGHYVATGEKKKQLEVPISTKRARSEKTIQS